MAIAASPRNFFRILSVLTMGRLFLPIIFEWIIFPLSAFTFYFVVWVVALLLAYPKVYFTRKMMYLYILFAFYMLFGALDIWEVETTWIKLDFVPIFFAILVYQYFRLSEDTVGLNIMIKATFVFISVTIITTILGLQKYPMASREMGGMLGITGEIEKLNYYKSLGIVSYGFFSGLAFIFPVLISFLKSKKIGKRYRYLLLVFIPLATYGLIKSQLTTLLLFAAIGAILAIWSVKNPKKAIRILIVFLAISIALSGNIGRIILNLSAILPGETLQSRLFDLGVSLTEGIGEEDTHIDRRVERIPFLWQQFSESPIFGGGETTGHVFWLDKLSMFGLIGLIPWFLILRNHVLQNLKIIDKPDHIYFLVSIVLFIALGFMKNMGGNEFMMFIFCLIPLTLVFKQNHLKSNRTESEHSID